MEENFKYEKCTNCGRKFFEGKLKMHLKMCTPQKPMKVKVQPPRSKSMHHRQKLPLPKKSSRNNSMDRSLIQQTIAVQECQICQRKLNPRNMEHHLEICSKQHQDLMYKKMLLEKQLKKKAYHCKNCNYEMEIDHNFCGKCGTKKLA